MANFRLANIALNFIGTCFFLGLALYSTDLHASCAPGQYQAIFKGTLWNINYSSQDELRAYFVDTVDVAQDQESSSTAISAGDFSADNPTTAQTIEEPTSNEETGQSETVYTYAGSTADNPGTLAKKDKVIEFAIYVCGDETDVGKELQFRYAKLGETEYYADPLQGDTIFNGHKLDFITGISSGESKNLVLKVTRSQPWKKQTESDEPVVVVEQKPKAPLRGDVNNDNKVDSSDAAEILQYILMYGGFKQEYDINGDGRVNDNDVRAIYLIMSGADQYLSSIPDVNANTVLRHILIGTGYEAQFDVNGDGKVDINDVKALYQQGQTTTEDKVDASVILQAILVGDTANQQLDINKDGKVDINDIQMLYQPSDSAGSPSEFPEPEKPVFSLDRGQTDFDSVLEAVLFGSGYDKQYDINGDGKIGLDDVQYLYSNNTQDTYDTNSLVRAILFGGAYDPHYDLNGDGRVDMEDLHKLYEK